MTTLKESDSHAWELLLRRATEPGVRPLATRVMAEGLPAVLEPLVEDAFVLDALALELSSASELLPEAYVRMALARVATCRDFIDHANTKLRDEADLTDVERAFINYDLALQFAAVRLRLIPEPVPTLGVWDVVMKIEDRDRMTRLSEDVQSRSLVDRFHLVHVDGSVELGKEEKLGVLYDELERGPIDHGSVAVVNDRTGMRVAVERDGTAVLVCP